MHASLGNERAPGRDLRLAVADRRLVEKRRVEIVGNACEVLETERLGREGRVEIAHFLHRASSGPADSAVVPRITERGKAKVPCFSLEPASGQALSRESQAAPEL